MKRNYTREERAQRRQELMNIFLILYIIIALSLSLCAVCSPVETPSEEEPEETTHVTQEQTRERTRPQEEPQSRYPEITDKEIDLIAKIVYLEARGESADGQQAVAEVILNRVVADNFPDTVSGVVTQQGQFSTIGSVDIAMPDEMQYSAVQTAIQGDNILPLEVVYFSGKGENSRIWGEIGGHVFCYQYEW